VNKHIVDNTCARYISRGTGDRKASNSKLTLKVTQGHWCCYHSIGNIIYT